MKHLLYLAFFAITTIFVACQGGDDDGGMPLVYNICGAEDTFAASEKIDLKQLTTAEIPSSVRSYISGEFPGYEIRNAASFQTDLGTSYIEVTTNNGGVLLFDAEGTFVCGDESFSSGGYGDDDDDDDGYGDSDDDDGGMDDDDDGMDDDDDGMDDDDDGMDDDDDGMDDDDDGDYIDPANLPQAILDYIAANHPNANIDEAELEDGVYEVELDNGVELCFDAQGAYIGNDC